MKINKFGATIIPMGDFIFPFTVNEPVYRRSIFIRKFGNVLKIKMFLKFCLIAFYIFAFLYFFKKYIFFIKSMFVCFQKQFYELSTCMLMYIWSIQCIFEI